MTENDLNIILRGKTLTEAVKFYINLTTEERKTFKGCISKYIGKKHTENIK